MAHRRWTATRIAFVAVWLGLGLGVGAGVAAQTMYRCGSVYQDRPCAGEQPGRIVGRTAAPEAPGPAAAARPSLDADCAQRGEQAQRLMWRREAGVSEAEARQSAARTGEGADVIGDVYRRRGSSVEVRAAIEADCMAEKQRAVPTQALIEALERARASAGTSAAPPRAASSVAR